VPTPWIFIHDTDIVDKGLIVLFSVFFFVVPSPPPGNFSAEALDSACKNKVFF